MVDTRGPLVCAREAGYRKGRHTGRYGGQAVDIRIRGFAGVRSWRAVRAGERAAPAATDADV